MKNNTPRPKKTKQGVTCRTNISAGTCADDMLVCSKSGSGDSPACQGIVNNSTCCPALGK